MSIRITSFSRDFEKHLQAKAERGLKRGVQFYHSQLKLVVNKPNSGVRGKSGKTVYPDPSKPGEPPRKRTGFGQRGIVREFDGLTARVGVTKNALYMAYLELGTSRIAKRPWVVSTLRKHRNLIGKLMATGGKG